jgi:hypothetical protein
MNYLGYAFMSCPLGDGLLVYPYAFSRWIAMLYKEYVNTLFLHPSGRAQLWPKLDRNG